jgi:hypothetical protein
VDDLATRAFVAVCILLIGGYAVGLRLNRRAGQRMARWVREGLAVTGGSASIRWLGASGFTVEAGGMSPPLAALTATALLLPREVTPLWLYYRLRRRPDLLVLRFQLRAAPRHDIEVVARGSPFAPAALAELAADRRWATHPVGRFAVATRDPDRRAAERVWHLLEPASAGVLQLSIRPGAPHMKVGVAPAHIPDAPAFWRALAEAARLVAGGTP